MVFVAVQAFVLGVSFLSYTGYHMIKGRTQHEGGKKKKKSKKEKINY